MPARPAVAPRAGAVPPPRPRSTSGPVRVTPVAKPAATAAVKAAVAIPPAPVLSAIPATPNGTHVYVSLAAIAAHVPESISHKVPAQHDKFVAIPLEFIVPQLSQGQIVLTGAELIASSTEFFGALTPQDEVSVSLPLADVVQQVPKEYFVRKNKRKVEVPAEVASVFAANGHGVSIARPPAAPAAPAYRSQPAVTSTSAQPVPAPTPAAAKISISPQSLAAMKAATAAPTPVVTAPPVRQAPPTLRAITPAPGTPPTSAPAPAPAPAPMLRKVAPPAPKMTGELMVPLAAVSPDWDQEVRRQLSDIDQTQHQILVPLELLAPAMKSGKVLFSWAEVATWIQPPLPAPPTPKVGEMPVEFVLKVIAPLFMQSQNSASSKRVAVDETIPDLFGGNAKEPQNGHASSSAQIQTPLAPASAPARAITPAPAPAPTFRTAPVSMPAVVPVAAPAPVATPVAAPVSEEISADQVIGPEGSRFGAKEIVINTSRLPGVAGALLAMSDGLLVTSATPPTVKGETIAAFLPQMFGRMNQYTKELALGPLQQLTLGIESGQWHIVKGPNIYFAVLGKRGETLPLNLLAQVAAELSNQSK